MGITIRDTHRFSILRTNLKPIKDFTKEMRTTQHCHEPLQALVFPKSFKKSMVFSK
jgi:hypothetical protein